MKPVLTTAQMRHADRWTIDELGIPGFTLMEAAGRGAASEIAARFGPLEHLSVCCLCGKGNNGGDALVIARLIADAGADVVVQFALGTEDLSADMESNLRIVETLRSADESTPLEVVHESRFEDRGYDLIVDGLLGTGTTADLRDPIASLVRQINESGIPVASVDLPTGLNADTGLIMGDCVTADLTITMGALKQGLLLNDGPDVSGEIAVVEIGIPRFVLEGRIDDASVRTWLPEHGDIVARIPARARRSHKYSAGLVLAVAGSPGLTGAPAMASTAAARVGAGAVVCACPATVQPILASKLEEVMTLGLPETNEGLDPAAASGALQERLSQASAILVGCGLGRAAATGEFVRTFLGGMDLPAVIDADALYAVSSDYLRQHGKPGWILTPHPGEFRQLTGIDTKNLNPVEAAREAARKWNVTIILKGSPTVVGTPAGDVFVSPTGNQALASAGTGDVLAGMCAGYLSQGLQPADAAITALYVGGCAVERFSERYHLESMVAGDITDLLPEVLTEFAS